jgi:hypothetical protein
MHGHEVKRLRPANHIAFSCLEGERKSDLTRNFYSSMHLGGKARFQDTVGKLKNLFIGWFWFSIQFTYLVGILVLNSATFVVLLSSCKWAYMLLLVLNSHLVQQISAVLVDCVVVALGLGATRSLFYRCGGVLAYWSARYFCRTSQISLHPYVWAESQVCTPTLLYKHFLYTRPNSHMLFRATC